MVAELGVGGGGQEPGGATATDGTGQNRDGQQVNCEWRPGSPGPGEGLLPKGQLPKCQTAQDGELRQLENTKNPHCQLVTG